MTQTTTPAPVVTPSPVYACDPAVLGSAFASVATCVEAHGTPQDRAQLDAFRAQFCALLDDVSTVLQAQ